MKWPPTPSRCGRLALAAALSLLALCALYAPLVWSHGPAATGDQLAQAALRTPSLPYPFDCVM